MGRQNVMQSHLEALMQQVLEVEELNVTDDGFVNVKTERSRYSVRLRPGRKEPHIEVYSVIVSDAPLDPGLFEALNSMNQGFSHCRAVWEEDKVVIAGELVAEAADVIGLACLCGEVAAAADAHGLGLAAVYGRPTAEDEEEDE